MTPQEAIDRVIYLLDRSAAPAPKVRAFQHAREIVAELPADELDRLVRAGRLQDLEGIGPSTGGVVAEAHEGCVPRYLAELERTSVVPLGKGAPHRAALRGDCHSHSTWSDGGAPIEVMARTAIELGHEYLVITDHSARLTVAHGLDADRLRAQLDEIADLNGRLAPFRILTGMEVDVFEDGGLDLDEDLLGELDLVVASIHSRFRLDREAMTRRMVLALASPYTDILGHMTNRKIVGRGRPPVDFDPEVVLAAAARFDKAIEVNCRPERQDPPEELLELAVEWGCRIAIDTDAHAPGQLEWLNHGCDKAARCGVAPDQVVNSWSATDLVAWAASHEGR